MEISNENIDFYTRAQRVNLLMADRFSCCLTIAKDHTLLIENAILSFKVIYVSLKNNYKLTFIKCCLHLFHSIIKPRLK